MLRSPSLLLAALLLPWTALAQELPPDAEPSSAQGPVTAPPLMSAPEDAAAATSPATPGFGINHVPAPRPERT